MTFKIGDRVKAIDSCGPFYSVGAEGVVSEDEPGMQEKGIDVYVIFDKGEYLQGFRGWYADIQHLELVKEA